MNGNEPNAAVNCTSTVCIYTMVKQYVRGCLRRGEGVNGFTGSSHIQGIQRTTVRSKDTAVTTLYKYIKQKLYT